jgi:ricin-type beta-trefoil lectin protein
MAFLLVLRSPLGKGCPVVTRAAPCRREAPFPEAPPATSFSQTCIGGTPCPMARFKPADHWQTDQGSVLKKRTGFFSLCVTAMTVCSLIVGATPASATITNTFRYYHLENLRSHACIDVGPPVEQWRCLNTFNEEWTDDDEGGGWSEIVSHASFLCLAQADSTANGTAVVQEPCSGEPSQLWYFSNRQERDGVFSYQLVNFWSFQCLDLNNGDPSNGVPMQVWDCAQTDNQRWVLL